MKILLKPVALIALMVMVISCQRKEPTNEWLELFNGEDLSGWKANENDASFNVIDGVLVATGQRSHLFYVGEDGKASFKNFELSVDIMTTNTANSGVYFHTKWQDEGWPEAGIEAQVNVSHKGGGDYREVKKGGSFYSVRNVYKAFAKDDEWYNMTIKVEGKRLRISIDNKLLVDYIEPKNPARFRADGQDLLGSGTFALQCHDPDSKAFYKSIKIKVLPDDIETPNVPANDEFPDIIKHQSNHIAFIDMNVVPQAGAGMASYLDTFYKSGVNLGVIGEVTELTQYPVFSGVMVDSNDDETNADALSEKYDYRIGKVAGDDFVNYLKQGRIDIWLDAFKGLEVVTQDELIMNALEAAKSNNVSIAISCKDQWPSIDILRKAKEIGCQFSTIDMISSDGKVDVTYFTKVIDEVKLDYKDIYIPDKMLLN